MKSPFSSCGPIARIGLIVLGLGILTPMANAIGPFAIGVQTLLFQDERLSDLYDYAVGVTVAADLYQQRYGILTFEAGFLTASQSLESHPYVDASETSVRFLPARLQFRLVTPPQGPWSAYLAPQIAWAYFKESWNAEVTGAGISASQDGSGTWIGGGAQLGVRADLGTAGALRAAYEIVWTTAEREGIPELSNGSTGEMTGGWHGFHLIWEVPWLGN